MPLGKAWSFPASDIAYETTLAAMQSVARKIVRITLSFTDYAHPLDINKALEPEYLRAAYETSREMKLSRPIPKLCTLVTASPVDAALHDAFRRLHGLEQLHGLRQGLCAARSLAPRERRISREYLDRYILPQPTPRIHMYHSVGASDPLTPSDVNTPIRDGLPETLHEWIPYNGVTAIKIKLNGDDIAWMWSAWRLSIASPWRPRQNSVFGSGSTRWISTSAAPTCSTCSTSNTS